MARTDTLSGMPETHHGEANVKIPMPGVNKRKPRTRRRAVPGEPEPEDRSDVPVLATCPVCGSEIPHASNLQRFIHEPVEGTSGQYACSEACAEAIADRMLVYNEAAPDDPPGVQWVRRSSGIAEDYADSAE